MDSPPFVFVLEMHGARRFVVSTCPDKPDRRVAGTAKSHRGVFCYHLECSSLRDDILGMVKLGNWDIAELPVISYERTRSENKVRRLVPFLRNTDSTESRTAQTPEDAHPAEVTRIYLLGWLNDYRLLSCGALSLEPWWRWMHPSAHPRKQLERFNTARF